MGCQGGIALGLAFGIVPSVVNGSASDPDPGACSAVALATIAAAAAARGFHSGARGFVSKNTTHAVAW